MTECDPELELFLDEDANGFVNGDSVGVDLATCVKGLERLADVIMLRDHAGGDPETVSVLLNINVTSSCSNTVCTVHRQNWQNKTHVTLRKQFAQCMTLLASLVVIIS